MTPDPFRPSHAYVPGQTPRHPEGSFDALTGSVRPGMAAHDLAQTEAFRVGLDFLEEGYFWEAHELLEPVWMALPVGAPEKRFVQALIQLANGFLKLKMHRPKAALRLAAICEDLVGGISEHQVMAVSVDEIRGKVAKLKLNAQNAL